MGGELATLGGFLMQVEDVIREDAGEWNPGVTVVPCRGTRWDLARVAKLVRSAETLHCRGGGGRWWGADGELS